MAGIGAGYDLSVSTFSPDGRVFQVEYAAKAVETSGTALSLVCKDGVVLAVERILKSPMVLPASDRRIYAIDRHIGIVVTGWLPDAQNLVSRARSEAANYKRNVGEPIPGDVLARRIALYVHAYTLYWSVRPYGASLLVACLEPHQQDGQKFTTFGIEPAGTAYQYKGHAYGRGHQTAKTHLDKLENNCTCDEAVKHLVKILQQVIEENGDKNRHIEVAVLSSAKNEFIFLPESEISVIRQQASEELMNA